MATIEKENKSIIVWNDDKNVGIKFQEGETMQLYTHEVITDFERLDSEEGITRLNAIVEELVVFASEKYPKEFAEIG